MKNLRKLLVTTVSILAVSGSIVSLTSCGGTGSTTGTSGSGDKETIQVWGPAEHKTMYENASAEFIKANPDFNVQVVYSDSGDAGAYSNLSTDVQGGAAVYSYVNDMLVNLRRIGAAAPIPSDNVTWISENNTAGSVASGKIGEKYYGYPITDDNGYFMFFNKQAFVDTAVWDSKTGTLKAGYTFQDLFSALDEKGGKWAKGQVTWAMGDSFYDSGVFFGCGGDYDVQYDENLAQTGVSCSFGYTKTDGVEDYTVGLESIACMKHSMLNADGTVNKHFAFTDGSTASLNNFITKYLTDPDNPLAACVCGPWKTTEIRDGTKDKDTGEILKAGWGTDAMATVLPMLEGRNSSDTELISGETLSAKGKMYQMKTFAGYKLLGVNPMCKYATESKEHLVMLHKFAKYLSEETFQIQRYEASGSGPSNIAALNNETIKADFALQALKDQKDLLDGNGYRIQSSVPSNYWTPIQVFGAAVYDHYANGTKGSFDTHKNATRTLKQLQYDIVGAAQ